MIDISPLLCYNVSMKKAIVITAIVALAVGAGGGMWLKTHLDDQATAKPVQVQAQPEPEPKKDKYDVGPADAGEILELVNTERARIGVAPLIHDDNVRMSAQLKSDDMLAKGYKQHNIPGTDNWYSLEMANLMSKAGCRTVSENFYWAGFEATSRDAFNQWMNSEPHRKAIQDPEYTKIGLGISRNSDNSKTYAVQHFCISR